MCVCLHVLSWSPRVSRIKESTSRANPNQNQEEGVKICFYCYGLTVLRIGCCYAMRYAAAEKGAPVHICPCDRVGRGSNPLTVPVRVVRCYYCKMRISVFDYILLCFIVPAGREKYDNIVSRTHFTNDKEKGSTGYNSTVNVDNRDGDSALPAYLGMQACVAYPSPCTSWTNINHTHEKHKSDGIIR